MESDSMEEFVAPTSDQDTIEQDRPAALLTLPLDILHHVLIEHLSQNEWWVLAATCKTMLAVVQSMCAPLMLRKPHASLSKVAFTFPGVVSLQLGREASSHLRNIECITELTNLRELSLAHCLYITPAESLSLVGTLTRLKRLSFAGTRLNNDTIRSLRHLSASLVKLDLRGCDLLTMDSFKQLGALQSLTYLGLSSTYVQTSDMEILSHQLQKLEVLDLTYCMRITVHVLEHLTNLKQLHTVKFRRLSLGVDSAVFHTYLDHLNRLENLQSLQLSDKEVDALALQILATACLPRLRHLNLSYATALDDLDMLVACRRLEQLDLNHCVALEDVAFLNLTTNHHGALNRLTHLDIRGCSHTNEGVRALAALPSLRSVVTGPGHHDGAGHLSRQLQHVVVTVGAPYEHMARPLGLSV